jgi:hypothetical protein
MCQPLTRRVPPFPPPLRHSAKLLKDRQRAESLPTSGKARAPCPGIKRAGLLRQIAKCDKIPLCPFHSYVFGCARARVCDRHLCSSLPPCMYMRVCAVRMGGGRFYLVHEAIALYQLGQATVGQRVHLLTTYQIVVLIVLEHLRHTPGNAAGTHTHTHTHTQF